MLQDHLLQMDALRMFGLFFISEWFSSCTVDLWLKPGQAEDFWIEGGNFLRRFAQLQSNQFFLPSFDTFKRANPGVSFLQTYSTENTIPQNLISFSNNAGPKLCFLFWNCQNLPELKFITHTVLSRLQTQSEFKTLFF